MKLIWSEGELPCRQHVLNALPIRLVAEFERRTLKHRLMHLFRLYPWECLTCQNLFFHSKRYSRAKRNALGEVYTGSEAAAQVSPQSEEGFQRQA